MKHQGFILESISLAIIGVLAEVLGGLAVGIVTGRPSSSTSAAAK